MNLIHTLESQLSRLQPSDRRALVIACAFLFAVGGFVYVLEPLIISYQSAFSAKEDLGEKRRRYHRQVTLLPRREAKLAEYSAELAAIQRRFDLEVTSVEAAVSRTINELTYYARLANITIEGISPMEVVNNNELLEIPFEVEATGEYEDLVKFFYYIDTSPSLLAMTDLYLGTQSQGLQIARLTLVDIVNMQNNKDLTMAGTIAPKNQLRVLLSNWTGYAPLIIAKANGYLDTESIQVDLLQVDDNINRLRLLASGDADAIGTTLPALLNFWTDGIVLKVVMPLSSTMGTEGIVVRSDSNIVDVADLLDQSIAVDTEGLLQFILYQALIANSMHLDDVDITSSVASQVARDMRNGTLEIGVTREPYLSALVGNNLARLIYTSNEEVGQILDLLAVTPNAAEQKSDAVDLLLKGVLRARHFINEQPERAVEIVAAWQNQPTDITRGALSDLTLFDNTASAKFFAEDHLTSSLDTLETYFQSMDEPFPLLTREDIINSTFFDKVQHAQDRLENDD